MRCRPSSSLDKVVCSTARKRASVNAESPALVKSPQQFTRKGGVIVDVGLPSDSSTVRFVKAKCQPAGNVPSARHRTRLWFFSELSKEAARLPRLVVRTSS